MKRSLQDFSRGPQGRCNGPAAASRQRHEDPAKPRPEKYRSHRLPWNSGNDGLEKMAYGLKAAKGLHRQSLRLLHDFLRPAHDACAWQDIRAAYVCVCACVCVSVSLSVCLCWTCTSKPIGDAKSSKAFYQGRDDNSPSQRLKSASAAMSST